ncbi:hypothetical protein M2J86_19215 [Citrobacter freundii]|uniref:hypothetical protein n=1 Tax=Citrobacter freundii TaxID=546 RepID=UPI0022DDB3B3|nr:hypothetical protein [Citrobacter freundii]WBM54210.1 hypothetical protein M2J86_19215 [Citrobacter freundii]
MAGYSACLTSFTSSIRFSLHAYGYIARQDDDIDWPLKRDNPTEDHGYAAFISEKITGGRSDGY